MGMMERLRGDQSPRVALIGLDGVPFSLLEDHLDRFEHINALVDAGSGTAIEGIVPAASSVTWPALTTGLNPGETGVYGLVDRYVNTYETYVTAADDVQVPHVWDLATQAELDATVLNAPVTYPPQRNLTRMVSDYQAPDVERAAYPRTVVEEIEPLDYRLDVDATLGPEDTEAFLEDAYETIDARYEAIVHYLERADWDLLVGVFTTPDRVNHFLYGEYLNDGDHREDFLSFYEQLDTYLGAIRSHLGEDTHLLVVSEHGFAPLEYEVDVNAWLAEREWLSYRTDSPGGLADIADESRAFSLAPGRIYLNLEGREPRGAVPDAEYELVRDRLRQALSSWTGPDGAPVARDVVTREELYRGPHVDLAPDLVVIPQDGFDLQARFDTEGPIFDTTMRTGMHRETDGTYILDIPDVSLADATIYDVTPTILELLNIPFELADFDGKSVL